LLRDADRMTGVAAASDDQHLDTQLAARILCQGRDPRRVPTGSVPTRWQDKDDTLEEIGYLRHGTDDGARAAREADRARRALIGGNRQRLGGVTVGLATQLGHGFEEPRLLVVEGDAQAAHSSAEAERIGRAVALAPRDERDRLAPTLLQH